MTNEKSEFRLRPRPQGGIGAALIGREEEALVLDVLRRKELFRYYGADPSTPPPVCATLEREFGELMGAKYALAVTSGTAALEVALGALGVGPGDEVIIPAWSWISCFTSVVRMGALPVLAEMDETFCLASGEITRLSTPRTKAVIIVHYQGIAADLDALLPEARAAGIRVLEDCAESPGASLEGKRVGTMGDIGTFSFQYHKPMTCGEGGMVVTDDALLYERAVRMHDIGQMRPYHQQFVYPQEPSFSGSQFRMTELQAAVALAQLRKLDAAKAQCRRVRDRIMSQITDLPGIEFRRIPDSEGDWGLEIYLYLQNREQADSFRERLESLNVNSVRTTGTYSHYDREYCQLGLAHHPAASPFAGFEK